MKNIYLIQPSNLEGVDGRLLAWLPYSIGCLWAYVIQFKEITNHINLKEILAVKEPIDELTDRLDDPDMVGFSCYVWNFNYNIALSKKIKLRYPNCKIVFGGPHINKQTIDQHTHIDSIIIAEGEINFKQLLEDFINKNLQKIYQRERINDLTILPSPYGSGVFNQLLDDNPELYWAATIETNRGCPYSCSFCDWGSLTASKVYNMGLDRLQDDIDWTKDKKTLIHVNVADANFGIFKQRDLAAAKIIREVIDHGHVESIWVSYAKKYNKEMDDIVLLLNQDTGFNISLQSDNVDTLKAIKRKNLPEKDIANLIKFADENNISHEQEYIVGLPLETKESWYEAMTGRLDEGKHKIFDVFMCSILPNTEMANVVYREKYKITSVLTPDLNSVAPSSESDFQILENSEIVTGTSTMSSDEIIDCYLFSQIINHIHSTGYSYIISQIANKQFKVSMLDFYLEMERLMYADPDASVQLNLIKSLLHEVFNTGRIKDPKYRDTGRLDYLSYQPFFKLKNKIMQLAIEAFRKLTKCNNQTADAVQELQKNYIFDVSLNSSIEFTSQFDIVTFVQKEVKYQITQKLAKKEFIKKYWKGSGSFSLLHERHELVNTFTEIPTARSKLEKLSIEITN